MMNRVDMAVPPQGTAVFSKHLPCSTQSDCSLKADASSVPVQGCPASHLGHQPLGDYPPRLVPEKPGICIVSIVQKLLPGYKFSDFGEDLFLFFS